MLSELEKTSLAVSTWRGDRKSQRVGRIPEYLKKQIISLGEHYPSEVLASRFGLKLNTLKNWLASSKEEINFVPVLLKKENPSSPEVKEEAVCLTVELINGIKLRLTGQTSAELLEFTCGFVKGLAE